jgi:predicted aconitase/predicted aconitase with swiveling domain
MGSLIKEGRTILPGAASGRVVASTEALSFWGGVDPATGCVIDTHHPLRGVSLTDAILVMPTSRGSCSGSGVLLDMALSGRAPAALVFSGEEDVLTLGALVACEMFGKPLPVVRLEPEALQLLSRSTFARIGDGVIAGADFSIPLAPPAGHTLQLTSADTATLEGARGEVARQAMQIICAMAVQQGASQLVDVTRVHIDGCIYASPANLIFAEQMAEAGAKVCVPTTTNAISVDHANWREQGVALTFGLPAARLADAYVQMGCQPSFTCSPYLLDNPPVAGECIGWAESNAVIFANTVLGARTAKHPDFLDLCIALTGRAPLAGPYLDLNRKARRIIDVEWPEGADASVWPLIGYLAGHAAPDRIPLLRGLAGAKPSPDDLKALCAAFGTTSAAPMLHIEGVTSEAADCLTDDADRASITRSDLAEIWSSLNEGPDEVDLVAFGSPHASLEECRAIVQAFDGSRRRQDVAVILTIGRDVLARAREERLLDHLQSVGVQVVSDICWCSISEPVFPPRARTVMTNSGKYAHYGPGLSGRTVRFGSLADCVEAAVAKTVPPCLPIWLR